ncbi:MAG: hypothetical protein AAFR11_13995 [Pseudomonadota bacterium]
MIQFRAALPAAALALVAGCGGGQDEPEQTLVHEILEIGYSNSGSGEIDVAALSAALEALTGISTEYGAASHDAETGATVVEDVAFFLDAFPDARITVDETRIWDVSVEAIERLAAGEADGLSMVADRILFLGVASEGLALGEADLTLTMERAAIDDLALRPVERAAPTPEQGGLALFSGYAAMALATDYAIEAVQGVSFVASDAETGGEVRYAIDGVISTGWENGTLERTELLGFVNTIIGAGPEALEGLEDEIAADADPVAAAIEGVTAVYSENFVRMTTGGYPKGSEFLSTVDTLTLSNADIRSGLQYMARLEMPPVTETDLLDFGEIVSINQTGAYDGETFISVAEQRSFANDFEWLVPSDIRGEMTDLKVNLLTFVTLMTDQQRELGELGEAEMAAFEQQMADTKAVIEELGLQTIVADGDFAWGFDGAGGDASLEYSLDIDDLVLYKDLYRLSGPSLEGWAGYAEGGFTEEDQAGLLSELLIQQYRTSITDRQLIDKVMVVASKQMGSTPEDMKVSAPAMIRVSGSQLAVLHPKLPEFVEALAAWVEKSGTLTASANPNEPVTVLQVVAAGQENPAALIDLLNLDVEHSGGE